MDLGISHATDHVADTKTPGVIFRFGGAALGDTGVQIIGEAGPISVGTSIFRLDETFQTRSGLGATYKTPVVGLLIGFQF